MNNIETRLSALERQNKLLRLGFVSALLIGAALFSLGFGKSQIPDKLQAKKFEVVDDAGHVLARLDNFEGVGSLTTYTPKGEILVDIVPSKSGAGGIVVYDGAGKQNLVVTDVAGGGGSIRINNSKADTTVSLGRNVNEAGSITIYNKNGKTIDLLTGDTAEGGTLITYDANDKQTGRVPQG